MLHCCKAKSFSHRRCKRFGRDFAQAIAEAGAQVVMADILDDLVAGRSEALQQKG
jgi:hypothetical protein